MQGATPRPEFQNMKYTNRQHTTKTKIFQFLQNKLGITARYSTFSMEALKTKVLIWGLFMSSSITAAIHFWANYLANLEDKNMNFEEIESLFNITEKLILEHSEEFLNVKPLESLNESCHGMLHLSAKRHRFIL